MCAERTFCPEIKLLALQRITYDTDAMNTNLIEGFTWVVERRAPDSDLCVSDVASVDGSARWVRIAGLDLPADYLSAAEARELAGVLAAAADKLAPPG